MRRIVLAAPLAVFALSACSSIEPQAQDESVEKVYQTGSNLPKRNRGAAAEVKTVDPASVEIRPQVPLPKPGQGR